MLFMSALNFNNRSESVMGWLQRPLQCLAMSFGIYWQADVHMRWNVGTFSSAALQHAYQSTAEIDTGVRLKQGVEKRCSTCQRCRPNTTEVLC